MPEKETVRDRGRERERWREREMERERESLPSEWALLYTITAPD